MDCELCGEMARIFCDSDQANLCWACDEKVHRANFLVAKHHRNLLCNVCRSPTPWNSSGPSLPPCESVCQRCLDFLDRMGERDRDQESQVDNKVEVDGSFEGSESEEDDEEAEEEYEEDEEEEEEDGENQVVPLSPAFSRPLSPPAASSSSESVFSGGSCREALKRSREIGDISDSDEEIRCSSSKQSNLRRVTSDEATSPIAKAFPAENRSRSTSGRSRPQR